MTSDWLADDRQYTCTLQIDAHSGQIFEANDLARKLTEALNDYGYRRYFVQANIVPQKVTNTSNRTILSGVNYDNTIGFDCSFLITGNKVYQEKDLHFDYQSTTITSISATDQVNVTDHTVTNK